MARIVILKTNRTFYDKEEAAKHSITLDEFIEILNQQGYDGKEKVVFSNDNGYTYGYITESIIETIDE